MNKLLHSQWSIPKRIVLIVAFVALCAALTVGIFTALKISNKNTDDAKIASTQKAVPTSVEIIKKYTDSSLISDRNYYTVRQSMVTNTTIGYQLDKKDYGTNFTSVDHVQYDRKDKSTTNNSASLKSTTETFLTNLGMIKKSNVTVGSYTLTTYDSNETVCQVSDSAALNSLPASYSLSCISHTAVTAEYSSIDKLLDLRAKAGHAKENIAKAVRLTITERNKTLSTLAITRTSNGPMLTFIFAAIDNQWEYIGERVSPSVDVQDSFELSSDLKKAINNTKYDGFLAKYIQ